MIYLISGTSRSGKTLMAKKMMDRTGIPYLSLDWLVMGFTNGVPQYGIHDKLWPNEIAEKIWDFLSAMMESMLWVGSDHIIEGEAILPELIDAFMKKYPKQVKVCFVGYTEISIQEKVKDIYKYNEQKNDWLTKEPKAYVKDHIKNMIQYSKRIKKDCKQYNLKYLDTSKDFLETLDKAIDHLLNE